MVRKVHKYMVIWSASDHFSASNALHSLSIAGQDTYKVLWSDILNEAKIVSNHDWKTTAQDAWLRTKHNQ